MRCTCGQNYTDEFCKQHGSKSGQCRKCDQLLQRNGELVESLDVASKEIVKAWKAVDALKIERLATIKSERIAELEKEIEKRKEIGEATAKVLQECADKEAELEKENERLKADRKAYKSLDALLGENGQMVELYDEIEALEAKTTLLANRAESATTMLLKYGRHLSSCLVEQVLEIHKPYCTCGWEEAKAALGKNETD